MSSHGLLVRQGQGALIHSKIFQPIHPPDALDLLDDSQHLGPVDPLTVPAAQDAEPTEEEKRIEAARKEMPDVHSMLLLDDFEYWGQKVLSGTAWAYYRSAADREISECCVGSVLYDADMVNLLLRFHCPSHLSLNLPPILPTMGSS